MVIFGEQLLELVKVTPPIPLEFRNGGEVQTSLHTLEQVGEISQVDDIGIGVSTGFAVDFAI